MKKIMFNDKQFGLTEAVLSGRKTQTRRIIPQSHLDAYNAYCADFANTALTLQEFLIKKGYTTYTVGEVVAIAQCYRDLGLSPSYIHSKKDHTKKASSSQPLGEQAGWSNKMYVSPEFCIHHIRITGIKVEYMQSISPEDIAAEGIVEIEPGLKYTTNPKDSTLEIPARNLRGAFSRLIDGVSKKRVFHKNPLVYVFSFELVD